MYIPDGCKRTCSQYLLAPAGYFAWLDPVNDAIHSCYSVLFFLNVLADLSKQHYLPIKFIVTYNFKLNHCTSVPTASFLLPYTVMMVLLGVPVCFMELSLGQFTSSGPLTCWNMANIFKGKDITTVILADLGVFFLINKEKSLHKNSVNKCSLGNIWYGLCGYMNVYVMNQCQ